MLEDNSEKITINISVVDLGRIDYLVNQGFYGNRTDFLRFAIKRQLDEHKEWFDKEFVAKTITIGSITLSKRDVEQMAYQDYMIVGKLTIEDDVPLELFRKIDVFGKVQCSQEIKKYYQL